MSFEESSNAINCDERYVSTVKIVTMSKRVFDEIDIIESNMKENTVNKSKKEN